MPKFRVTWTKTYYASGDVEVEAADKEAAERNVLERIGDFTGSMQYCPDSDYVEAAPVEEG